MFSLEGHFHMTIWVGDAELNKISQNNFMGEILKPHKQYIPGKTSLKNDLLSNGNKKDVDDFSLLREKTFARIYET